MPDDVVVITSESIKTPYLFIPGIVKVTIEWTADSTGATVTTTEFSAAIMAQLLGRSCVLGTTVPDAVHAPTDSYDISILDALGVDIFGGALNNRSTSVNQQSVPLIATSTYGPRLVADTLSFKLENNAVNSAQGTCCLYFDYARK